MSHRFRGLVTAAAAAMVLFAASGPGSARNFSLSETHFMTGWAAMTFAGGEISVRCPVVVEGSFHNRTFTKTAGALVGYVGLAVSTEGSCSGGRVIVKEESLPWHVRYDSFTGTLPNITAVKLQLIGARIATEVLGIRCEYLSSATEPLVVKAIVTSGAMREIEPLGERTIRGTGGIFCPAAAPSGVSGTSESEAAPITITLI